MDYHIDIRKTKLMPSGFDGDSFKDIHLAIPANILCVNNRLEAKFLSIYGKQIHDFTATLYLGKITFKKNKQNNLSPIYAPSKIAESSFENLNLFWLNEINKNAKTPFKSLIKCEYDAFDRLKYSVDSTAMDYQKIHYFRTDKNITLSKNQIMSYFTELHSLNVKFIKDYIDSINDENGIKAYNLHKEIFSNLLDSGILQRDLFKWHSGNSKFIPLKEATLLALDYLKANNQANFKIVLFDELFYAYLVWSLREYLIDRSFGVFNEENNLLLNAGAYKDYANKSYSPYFYNNLLYGDDMVYENGEEKYKVSSPNNIANLQTSIFDEAQPHIFMPSPLGKYYFELSDSLDLFIEYFPKIYPQNPPKYWSKEMMSRLDLRLE